MIKFLLFSLVLIYSVYGQYSASSLCALPAGCAEGTCGAVALPIYGGITRTPWQYIRTTAGRWPEAPRGVSRHGDQSLYSRASIPAENDYNWRNCNSLDGWCKNSDNLGIRSRSRLSNCFKDLDFAYFQTFINIPAGTIRTVATVDFTVMDDGARVTIFNSRYPGGVVDHNGYAYLGQRHSNSFAQYLVEGRNRLVVTQVDDCQVENNIIASVSLNGQTLRVPTCSRCLEGWVLQNSVCVRRPNCNSRQFYRLADNTCVNCNFAANCREGTCTGPYASTCTACNPGFILRYGACVPRPSCTSRQFYRESDNLCVNCNLPANCRDGTCTGPYTASCTACNYGFVLVAGTCRPRPACTSRQFYRPADNTCVNCNFGANCRDGTCTGPYASVCTACNDGFVLISGVCQPRPACTSRQFYRPADNTCVNCNFGANCRDGTCTGPYASVCTACNPGFVLISGACQPRPTCNGRQYYRESDNTCPDCTFPAGCRDGTCTGPAASVCTACNERFVLISGVCQPVPTCTSSQYYNKERNVCVDCTLPAGCAAGSCMHDGVAPSEGITRTPWRYIRTPAGQFPLSPAGIRQHGGQGLYAPAVIPEEGAGWRLCNELDDWCRNSDNLGIRSRSRLSNCFGNLDFAYFQTYINIPVGTVRTTATIDYTVMDDGARVTIFNSQYPNGIVDPNGYAYLGQRHSNSFAQYLVEGRNRIVVTQVDDCAVENNIVATVSVNGHTLPIPTCTRCLDGFVLLNGVCAPRPTCTGVQYYNAAENQCHNCNFVANCRVGSCNNALDAVCTACNENFVLRDGQCVEVPRCTPAQTYDPKRNVCVDCDLPAGCIEGTCVLPEDREAADITRTPWQYLRTPSDSFPDAPPGITQHGNPGLYTVAAIPPETVQWGTCSSLDPWCKNGDNLGINSRSRLTNCLQKLDFGYFQTFITIPPNTEITVATVDFTSMDDGARITVFNSRNPEGSIDESSYAYLGARHSDSFASLLVEGRNRVVITQVDDCATENHIIASISVNGRRIPCSTCKRCEEGFTLAGNVCVPGKVPSHQSPPIRPVDNETPVVHAVDRVGVLDSANDASGRKEENGDKTDGPPQATETTTITHNDGTTTTVQSENSSESSSAITIVVAVFAGLVAAVLIVLVVVLLVKRGEAAEQV